MKNKEEDYLDTLLNIVSDEKEEDSSNGKSSEHLKTPENEFLKEFEEELNSDEDSDYLHEFEMELQADERRKAKPRYTEPEPEEKPKQPEPEPESKVEETPATFGRILKSLSAAASSRPRLLSLPFES